MSKVILWTLLVAVTFVAGQRQSTLRTSRRGTVSTTTEPADYADYSDQTSSEATTRSTTRVLATLSRQFQAKAKIQPTTSSKRNLALAAGSASTGGRPSSTVGRTSSTAVNKVAVLSSQNQDPWIALDNVRGRSTLSSTEILEIMLSANPGVDFPLLKEVPEPVKFQCQNQNQPGFYADPDFKCQGNVLAFRACSTASFLINSMLVVLSISSSPLQFALPVTLHHLI
jgi:hypothetical protein